MAVLSVNGISKSFGVSEILTDVSFSVNKNDKVAIIGDNGEGKSTLLKIITKQLEADKGSVYFENPDSVGNFLFSMNESEMEAINNKVSEIRGISR